MLSVPNIGCAIKLSSFAGDGTNGCALQIQQAASGLQNARAQIRQRVVGPSPTVNQAVTRLMRFGVGTRFAFQNPIARRFQNGPHGFFRPEGEVMRRISPQRKLTPGKARALAAIKTVGDVDDQKAAGLEKGGDLTEENERILHVLKHVRKQGKVVAGSGRRDFLDPSHLDIQAILLARNAHEVQIEIDSETIHAALLQIDQQTPAPHPMSITLPFPSGINF